MQQSGKNRYYKWKCQEFRATKGETFFRFLMKTVRRNISMAVALMTVMILKYLPHLPAGPLIITSSYPTIEYNHVFMQ